LINNLTALLEEVAEKEDIVEELGGEVFNSHHSSTN